jgi:hypothetical protein
MFVSERLLGAIVENEKSDLRNIFNYVRDNPSSNARQIGKIVDGGKSRANHYLYGYEDILFTKRGLTPPEWQVVAGDAYEKMIGRLLPQPIQTPTPLAEIQKPKAIIFARKNSKKRELPPISICYSCDLPIKPNGLCGCS